LSPMLFILVMDVLGFLIAKDESEGDIEGYVGDPLGAGSVIPSKEGYQE
jgi:hypothetical protein